MAVVTAPVRFTTKRDAVAEAIRHEILNGTLAPGTQLQQDELASRLGVSPTPVREAFGALQAEGFLENIPHRGVFVSNPGVKDLIDVYEMIAMVEGLALRRAITADPKDTLRRLTKLVARGEVELKSENAERIRRYNVGFHETLIQIAHSQAITEMAGKLRARSLFFLPFDLSYMRVVQLEHVAMLEALREGEVDHATQLLADHYRRHVERLKKVGSQDTAASQRAPVAV
jgi:DNA-binding GntR family transcriptional regulator